MIEAQSSFVLQLMKERSNMENTATLSFPINPSVKQQAEQILSTLGIPMATAIDIYLRQIAIVGGIPFSIRMAPVPNTMNADLMSVDEINQSLEAGYQDAISGRMKDAAEVFADLRKHWAQ